MTEVSERSAVNTVLPVVARGPYETAFCCPPAPRSTAGLSGFFVWEPTVTQSALRTFLHSFLSWDGLCWGQSRLRMGFRSKSSSAVWRGPSQGGRR